MNKGEVDELKASLALIYWRDNKENGIESVGFYECNGSSYFDYKSQ